MNAKDVLDIEAREADIEAREAEAGRREARLEKREGALVDQARAIEALGTKLQGRQSAVADARRDLDLRVEEVEARAVAVALNETRVHATLQALVEGQQQLHQLLAAAGFSKSSNGSSGSSSSGSSSSGGLEGVHAFNSPLPGTLPHLPGLSGSASGSDKGINTGINTGFNTGINAGGGLSGLGGLGGLGGNVTSSLESKDGIQNMGIPGIQNTVNPFTAPLASGSTFPSSTPSSSYSSSSYSSSSSSSSHLDPSPTAAFLVGLQESVHSLIVTLSEHHTGAPSLRV